MQSRSPTKALAFTAKIYQVGINPLVDVTKAVSEALGKRGQIPVKGTLDGHAIQGTLIPKGEGRHVFHINGAMRKAAQVDVGCEVKLVLARDARSRVPPIRPEFARALEANPRAQAVFNKFPPSHKKEYLRYLNNLKRADSVQRNVEKVIRQLLEKSGAKALP